MEKIIGFQSSSHYNRCKVLRGLKERRAKNCSGMHYKIVAAMLLWSWFPRIDANFSRRPSRSRRNALFWISGRKLHKNCGDYCIESQHCVPKGQRQLLRLVFICKEKSCKNIWNFTSMLLALAFVYKNDKDFVNYMIFQMFLQSAWWSSMPRILEIYEITQLATSGRNQYELALLVCPHS